MDVNKLKEAYLIEAEMHVKTINNALVDLEKNPEDKTLFHEVFRGIHTLKSLAATMHYTKTTKVCHAMEDVMDKIRNKDINLENSIDVLFKANDYLNENLKILEKNTVELDSNYLVNLLQNIMQGRTGEPSFAFAKSETIALEKIQTIAVKVDRLDTLMNLAEELLVNKLKFDLFREQNINPELNSAVESLGRLITDLQYYVLQVRLVPVGFVFNRFTRMVRDLGKEHHKPVDLIIEGGDIELDRLLIDEIGVSIAHLIRNAIDHGIESQSLRQKLNKPVKGIIKLCASRTKENAIIEVTDDGAGLDLPAIKRAAAKQNPSTDINEEDLINMVFSGVSTKKQVTETSGRGLGLAIVKEKIESIGGSIKIKTQPGKFTSFFMEIPLTLAIIKTLFVRVAEEIYAIPIEAIERLLVVSPDNIKHVLKDETIIFQDQDIPLIRLANLFTIKNASTKQQSIVLIKKGKLRLGLLVDQLLSTQEIVIKPLSKAVKNNKFFSGATMTGSGQVVLILDVNYLLTLTNKKQYAM